MTDPLAEALLEIKQDDWNADHYAHAIKSWGLDDTQIKVLKIMMDDIYMDGWGDGVAHKTNLTPDEVRKRLTNDIQNSWMRLIVERLITNTITRKNHG